MSGAANSRRKILVVNPRSQKRMILTISLVPAIALSLMMIMVCYFCYQIREQAIDLGIRFDGLVPLFLSVSGFLIVAALFVFAGALITSHRVAGPAYRIQQSVKQAHEGDIGFKVILRPGDYLTEVADEMNLLLDVLNENPPAGFKTRAMTAAASDDDDATADAATDDAELAACGAANESQ